MNANGGGWQHLLTNTQYPNDPGHQYTFRVTATDRVGNVGQGQASAIVTAVTRYYYFGGKRVAMRGPDDAVVWLHGDHLGSTSLATDAAQAVVSRQLYYPFGEQRWASAELPTDFQFTGQRIDAYIKLYQMGARWYDPQIGRWISPDTIIPDPANPQSLNRYSYVRNRPLNRIDPSGHQDEPAQNLPEWVQQVIEHLQGRGWHVVGDPSQVHPNWNGADQVFTDAPAEWTRVLGVELKDVASKVNLGTLGRSLKFDDYGGSISRIYRSAGRFLKSSREQLKLMSQTVRDAYEAGELENALFTSGAEVSEGAKGVFDGVFRVTEEGIETIKEFSRAAPAEVKKPDFWAQVGMGARAVLGYGKEFLTTLGGAVPPIIFAPPSIFRPYYLDPEPIDA